MLFGYGDRCLLSKSDRLKHIIVVAEQLTNLKALIAINAMIYLNSFNSVLQKLESGAITETSIFSYFKSKCLFYDQQQ
jgi:hypothetical protein